MSSFDRRMSVSAINDIYAQRVPGALWRVRYFRDSQVEEFAVTEKPDGSLHGFWHTLAEAAKGANLTKEEAHWHRGKISTRKEADQPGRMETGQFGFRQAAESHGPFADLATKHAARSGKIRLTADSSDHAYMRMSVTVLGDEPADYRTFIKIPDEFVRKQGEQTVGRILVAIFQVCVALALLIGVLVFFFKRLRVQPAVRIPWRRLFGWGLAGVVGYAVSFLFGRGIPALLQAISDVDAA